MQHVPVGDTEEEDENIVWGYHELPSVELPEGPAVFEITNLQTWAGLLDYVDVTPLSRP